MHSPKRSILAVAVFNFLVNYFVKLVAKKGIRQLHIKGLSASFCYLLLSKRRDNLCNSMNAIATCSQ